MTAKKDPSLHRKPGRKSQLSASIRPRAENEILKNSHRLYSNGDVRLWRNNVGAAWVGPHVMNADGSVTIFKPMRVRFGLCEGSADLIGFVSREIREEDVGKTVAQFVAAECKATAGRLRDVQKAYLEMVNAFGGRAGVFRSESELADLLGDE